MLNDWCYYRKESNNIFPKQKELLGHALGPSKNEGNKMAQNILNVYGNVIPRCIVCQLTAFERESVNEVKKWEEFDRIITRKLGNSWSLPKRKIDALSNDLESEVSEQDDLLYSIEETAE